MTVAVVVCCGYATRQSVELHSSADSQSTCTRRRCTHLPNCRALYGFVATVMSELRFLNKAVAIVLGFVGACWPLLPPPAHCFQLANGSKVDTSSTKTRVCLPPALHMPCVLLHQVSAPKATCSRAPISCVTITGVAMWRRNVMIFNIQCPACRRKNDCRVQRRGHQHAAQPGHCCRRASGGAWASACGSPWRHPLTKTTAEGSASFGTDNGNDLSLHLP